MGTTRRCEYCGGTGWMEVERVTGSWSSWNGPQLDIDEAPCRFCEAGERVEAESEPDYEAIYRNRQEGPPDFDEAPYW